MRLGQGNGLLLFSYVLSTTLNCLPESNRDADTCGSLLSIHESRRSIGGRHSHEKRVARQPTTRAGVERPRQRVVLARKGGGGRVHKQ